MIGGALAKTLRNGVAVVERIASRLPAPLGSLGRSMAASAKWALGSVAEVETVDRVIGLTFDDGPDPEHTPALLDVLGQHDARATFFMLAERAEANPDLARRVLAEGHEAALHGARHDILPRLGARAMIECIRGGKQRLQDVLGVPVTFFRPPYGAQNLRSYAVARLSGMQPVVWTAWAHDWEDIVWDEVVEHAMKRVSPGRILLLHDSFTTHPDRPQAAPPRFDRQRVLREILGRLAAVDLEPVSVGDLMSRGKTDRTVWFETGAGY